MANEITVRTTLRVVKSGGNLNYAPSIRSFNEDLASEKGPTPGYLSVSVDGENVLFDELVTPGRVRIQNLDATNYVEYGLHDGTIFHPWGELLPGTEVTFRFSRNFREEANVAPGTGTTGNVNYFYLKANTAACGVIVDCFEA